MEGNRTPGYWAVIPATVRYDNELRPNAKLLYGEISALAMAEGYCWAQNDYFARLFEISKKTVSALISQLAQRGHIRLEVVRDPETNEVTGRKIWITNLPPQPTPTPPPKNEDTSPQKCGDPPPKNGEENNTRVNNNPPISPPRGERAGASAEKEKTSETMTDKIRKAMDPEAMKMLTESVRGRPPELVHAWFQYLECRMANHKPVRTKATVERLLAKLDKLSDGNDATKVAILEQSVEFSWQGLYALDEPREPRRNGSAAPDGRVIEDEWVDWR